MSIRKPFLIALLVVIGLKFGYDYITSEDFQKYADKKKFPWTCQVNMALAGMYDVMSEYSRSYNLYERVLTRCPEQPVAADALFLKANDLENLSRPSEAMTFYLAYLEKYPNGKDARNAQRASDRIRFSR